MSRPTTTTLTPLRAAVVRVRERVTGAPVLRLLDRLNDGQREIRNRLHVQTAAISDTRLSLHRRFDHLETVMTDVRSEFNQNLSDLGTAIGALSTRIDALPDDANDITQADLDAIKSLTGQVNTLAVAAPEVPTDEQPPTDETPTEGQPTEETPAEPVDETPASEDAPAESRDETVNLNDGRDF